MSEVTPVTPFFESTGRVSPRPDFFSPQLIALNSLISLRDWQARGVAEEIDGRWRLTRSGRAMFSAWVEAPLELDDEVAA